MADGLNVEYRKEVVAVATTSAERKQSARPARSGKAMDPLGKDG